jgi:hypothetical protein
VGAAAASSPQASSWAIGVAAGASAVVRFANNFFILRNEEKKKCEVLLDSGK